MRWQAQISYLYGNTNQFFVGDQRDDAAGPGGHPPVRKVSIWALDVFYGLSNRLSLDLTVPFLSSSGGNYDPDGSGRFYDFKGGGLGDVALQAKYWLNDPIRPSPVSGSVDVGIKAPTGSDSATWLGPNGVRPVDEALQSGNGGWELLLRAQGTVTLGNGPFVIYGSGFYGLSLTEHSDVRQGGAFRGVPDAYSARLGAAYLLPVLEGLVLTAGGRINGITVKDLVGGGDLYWRRPGYEMYVEPGLTLTIGSNMASFSVPVRVYQKKLDSLLDVSSGEVVGADFAPYLILASYARRF